MKHVTNFQNEGKCIYVEKQLKQHLLFLNESIGKRFFPAHYQ